MTKPKVDENALSDYYRIEGAEKFGQLLRTKRLESGLLVRELRETFGVGSATLSCVERAKQTIFHKDIVARLRSLASMLGIDQRALETTHLTHAQWRKHCRPYKYANAAETARKEEPPGRLFIPLLTPDPVREAMRAGLVAQTEMLVKLRVDGLLSEAAFRLALKDLASNPQDRKE